MPWLEPVFDREPSAFYNVEDLNRVEGNTAYLAEMLSSYGYTVVIVTVTDRTIKNIEFHDSLNRIGLNEVALVNAFYQPEGWEAPITNWVPVAMSFRYTDANRLERNLLLIKVLLDNTIKEFEYCGAFTCGAGEELS